MTQFVARTLSAVVFSLVLVLPASFGQSQDSKKPTPSSRKTDRKAVLKADGGPAVKVTAPIRKGRRTPSAGGKQDQDQGDTQPAQARSFRATSRPREDRLVGGRPFHGDVRTLPQVPPLKFERPEFEEPTLHSTFYPGGSTATQSTSPAANAPATGPSAPAPAPSKSFDGLDFANWGAGHPPDPNGDVGPQYYVQTINTSVGIYDKTTGSRVTAFTFNTLMSQGHFGNLCDTANFGDPVALYDTFEDRWVITDFAFQLDGGGNVIAPAYQCFAVSKSGDPVAGGWNFYFIQLTDAFGDYPKLGIWPDGIYMSANLFGFGAGGTFVNPRVWAFNKAQMYAGNPTVQVVSFDAPSADFTVLPSNARLQAGTPPPGTPNYFVSTWEFLNALTVYKFHVDWNSISLSTFTGPDVPAAATSWPNASVPNAPSSGGNSLDVLQIRAMVQNQYTNIGGHESLWTAHTVRRQNTTGFAAPRWYQVDVTGGTVAANLPQATTWDPDGANVFYRFVPSVAVDHAGDMAMGYSVSSAATEPAIKYAGRLAGDPVNTFSQTEQLLIQGTGTQTGTCGSTCIRWGDYSAMTLDPDGCTFWYTNEYYQTNGLNFLTRIGAFSFPSCTPVATGTISGTVTALVGGAPITGATVSLGSRTATTDINGNYSFAGLPSGTYPTITASSPGYVSSSATSIIVTDGTITTQNFSLALSAATHFAVSAPASATAGTAFNFTVTALDQFNNPVTGYAGTVHFTSSDGTATLPANSTLTNGTGTFSATLKTAGNQTITGTDTVTASITGTSNAIAVSAAAATHFAVSAPASATAGTAFNFTVTALDQFNNPATGYAGTVHFTSSDGAATLPANSTLTNGTGTFSATLKTAGTQTITGTDTVTASITGTSNAIAVSPAAATHFAISAPASATAGTAFNFTVTALDQFNNPATGYAGTVHFTSSDGAATLPANATLTNGTGTFSATLKTAGNQTITGTDTVTASITGTSNTIALPKAGQTISFGALPGKTFGDADFTVSATASSGLAVTFGASGNCSVAGSTVHITGAGSCTVTASQAGNANFNPAADVPQAFSIAKAAQTISFAALPGKTFGDPDFGVSATASSGLAVTAFAGSGNCSVTGSTVHITGAGSCTVTASQAGDSNFNPAADVPEGFAIAIANQSITFGAIPNHTFGDPDFAATATASSGLTVSYVASGSCTVSGATIHITAQGSCGITASQSGNANFNPAPAVPQTFAVAKATPAISLACPAGVIYDGSAHACTSSVTGVGGASVTGTDAVTYNGSPAAPSNVGNYAVSANFTSGDNNYNNASASSTLAISSLLPAVGKLTPIITAANSGAFTLNVNGTSFVPGAVLNWNGSPRTTTFMNASQISAAIQATDLATVGLADVTTFNPAPGGGTSTAFKFAIDTPPGTNGAITASTSTTTLTVTHGQSTTMQVTFTGAQAGTQINAACFNLPVGATCSLSGTTVTITTTASTPPGSYEVIVVFTATQTVTSALNRNRVFFAAGIGFLGLPLGLIWIGRTRKKALRGVLLGLAALAFLAALSGCGGSPKQPTTTTTQVSSQSSLSVTLNVN